MAHGSALEPGRDYVIKHTTRTTRARVTALEYRLDVNTLHRDKTATALKLNELGRITLRTQVPLLLDEYTRNSNTGSFILIDPDTNGTVAAGMVLRHQCGVQHRQSEHDAPHVTGHRRGPPDAGPHGAVHRVVGLGQVLGGDAGGAEAARNGHDRIRYRRRQPAARIERRSRVQHGRPCGEPAATGARRHAAGRFRARSCWCRPSARSPSTANWRAGCTPRPGATSTRCSAILRWRTARGEIPRGSTPKRVPWQDHPLHRYRQPISAAEKPGTTAHTRSTRSDELAAPWSSIC